MSFASRDKSAPTPFGMVAMFPSTPATLIEDIPPARHGNPFGYGVAFGLGGDVPAFGLWLWVNGDQSANVTSDGDLWQPPAGETGTDGAWYLGAWQGVPS